MAQTISATDSEVQKPVNVIYKQTLLRNARPLCPYFVGSMPGELQRNGGTATCKWRRFNTAVDNASGIDLTTTALSELTGTAAYMQGRDASAVHFTDATATVAKYGQFFILNEEVDLFNFNGTSDGIVRTLAISAGRSLNALQRNVLEDNATKVYAGGAASDGAVVSKITAAALNQTINTLVKNSAMPFTPMTNGSTNVGSTPVLPGFWALTHPDVAYDISNLSGFKSVETYSGQTATVPGEFGAYSGAGYVVRFIQSPEASIDADAGGTNPTGLNGTSDVDLYSTVVMGMEAFGSVGLGQMHGDGIYRGGDDRDVIDLISKGLGSGGTSDPFNEIQTIAWKSWHAGVQLNANWSRVIRSGATDLTA